MKLYGVIFSPFVQKALLAARFKGHDIPVEAPPGGSSKSPEFAAISPMRRIPVLADGELNICESSAIMAYLDEVLDGPALLPANPAGRARARALTIIADGELAAGLRPFVIKTFGGAVDPAVVTAAAGQISAGLDGIEALLAGDGPWAAGAAPTVADAAIVPFLVLGEMLGQIHGTALPPLDGRTRLDAYRARAFADPIAARTRREMLDGFAQVSAQRRQQQAQQQQ